MLLRRLFLAGLVLVALAFAWRFWGDALLPARAPERARPVAIEFDNGTVREPPVTTVRPAGTVPGQLTKCVRGGETVYTHFTCPPGHKAVPMAGGTVNVVAGTPRPAAAPSPAGASGSGRLPPGGAKASLHEALDSSPDPRLRERLIDRAVHESR